MGAEETLRGLALGAYPGLPTKIVLEERARADERRGVPLAKQPEIP